MIRKCKEIDIVVGIPSYNEADNIAFVARQLSLGLSKYFPSLSAAIINVDNNSSDGTREAFLGAETGKILKKYISTEKGIVGKGNNFRNLFIEVKRLKAKAIVVVDADLLSITPEWVKILATPVLEGHVYVTPLYSMTLSLHTKYQKIRKRW
jgi:glycosyltransferase involved in cell wall biosynthesis